MIEEMWQSGEDPQPMLRYLIGTDEPRVQSVEAFLNTRGSGRKLRLFACACYHRISRFLPHPVARETVSTAERFADGAVSVAEFRAAEAAVRELVTALEPRWRASTGAEREALHPTHAALALAGIVCWWESQKAAYYAASNAHLELPYLANPGVEPRGSECGRYERAEKRAQCELLREMFGNPFRSVAFSSLWRTSTAAAIAKQMYEARDFSAMPILADALQDAGCDSADALGHCRGPGPHVYGCWVADLVFSKE
ncbi:Uncharacterized protein OS=Sorangium cellulosum (strain So ce56) GN=sce5710 PE=4 SV=1 [Gemmata massiliana]|uniref:Uncharacterized protein n=1 Tax=Gemmata massiliana TaxID=1210884 RepID=A0A6P2D329_9BACT|nr:hypothetical protein [Gemmata massiliana]VTR93810.1 Uncharacterized protein OS=Sorangium cellulosum (strain So ce56) GN=sce5710 PE=4 SV=1 [Gemmata massiliana]